MCSVFAVCPFLVPFSPLPPKRRQTCRRGPAGFGCSRSDGFARPRGRSLVWVMRYTPQIKKVHVPGLRHLCVRFSSSRSTINRSWKSHLSGRLSCPGERFGLDKQPETMGFTGGCNSAWGNRSGLVPVE